MITCTVCHPNSPKANGYCAEHSTSGSGYISNPPVSSGRKKLYCTKHSLFHGQKYSSCKPQRKPEPSVSVKQNNYFDGDRDGLVELVKGRWFMAGEGSPKDLETFIHHLLEADHKAIREKVGEEHIGVDIINSIIDKVPHIEDDLDFYDDYEDITEGIDFLISKKLEDILNSL
jgi:hypothetical protein